MGGVDILYFECPQDKLKAQPSVTDKIPPYAYEEDFVANSWKTKTSSIRSNVVGNLQSGKKVYARVKAIDRRGQEVYSETQWRIVQ